MMRGIHHVGIVVRRLADAFGFYRDALGLPLLKEAVLLDQGVRAALLGAGDSELELLEPLDAGTGVGRFLARRGEGLHHLCFDTPDVEGALAALKEKQVELLDTAPRPGLAGQIAFLHPRACCGVLVELATPSPEASAHERAVASPVRLKRLVIGARDVQQTAETFQSLFGLPEVAMNSGPRVMLAVGRGALLVVPAAEVGGTEGMVALSLVAEDFQALNASFVRAGTRYLKGTGEVTVEPVSSHGVHLHISRYE
ncbi:MAG: methylmalonyl-CoA epimerase [Candidatus Rokubacteria bacterium RIFCSPHIGHO2_12_FULL_73_22]|nr:MAG: methylmalonyl-CoA epimerase [Candidatus Rokubacteria bacterium RIFCSPHIGHO2_02_FULL_73_26]OGK98354.1 MAG: methylmalonyl-CoA epimerase [Candidatus Rokubacteria bacterium RIFCSPHIGHO2_12_FULL_73_22]OGL12146.1 MAG: methylmalonyl-CoA epimerase [Candidatus Rokubacteria bacterium RIFCSPLOWO2_02_FULL_73_56]OGL24572.1 MAG: methylmalonyl-CoA epimerase [Candidatus Rokubacteria bacterium RIFCSPLOWO2_12_FULL_73_47]